LLHEAELAASDRAALKGRNVARFIVDIQSVFQAVDASNAANA
jgi:hypothetical protein